MVVLQRGNTELSRSLKQDKGNRKRCPGVERWGISRDFGAARAFDIRQGAGDGHVHICRGELSEHAE